MTTQRLTATLAATTLAAAAVVACVSRFVRPREVAPLAVSGESKSWTGELVMYTKPPRTIKFGDRIKGQQIDLPFGGVLPIEVREERAGRLRIQDEGTEGWVDKADFVLLRESRAYFQRRAQADPNDAWALQVRGIIRHSKGELDEAIKDFDESIRLDPTDSTTYMARGNAHSAKKDFERAVKDYDEASRLDPKYGSARYNRSIALMVKR